MSNVSFENRNNTKIKNKINSLIGHLMRYYMLFVVGYIVLYPLFYMISTAIKSEKALQDISFIWFPQFVTKEWFSVAGELLNFKSSLGRTVSLQLVSALIEIFSCAVAAYGFSRFEFKGKKIAMFFLILSLMIPISMYGMSLAVNYRNLDIVGVFGLFNKLTGIDLRPKPLPNLESTTDAPVLSSTEIQYQPE